MTRGTDDAGAAAEDRRRGPFRVGRDGADGLGRDVFRSRRFIAPTRGIRLGADRDGLRDRAAAVLMGVSPDAVICGPTAAQLWLLPLPRHLEGGPLTLCVPPGGAHPARRGVRAVRSTVTSDERTVRDGIAITTPARLFADLAALLAVPDLVAVGDAILRRGLAARDDLAAVLRRRRGRRGVRRARVAFDLLDARSESPQESRLRALLVLAGLPVPRTQYVVRDEHGGFVARVDLAYVAQRIAIEYDGADHGSERARQRDASRRTHLRALGWYVVEIVAADLRHPERAVAKVRAALATVTQWRVVGA